MESRIERRVLLQSMTVGIAGLSGCTLFGSQTESQVPRLVNLTAVNLDDAAHDIHVRLDLDGETVYRESSQVPAARANEARGIEFSDYPTMAEPYVLSAWRDDSQEAEARSLDFASFDTECLGVNIHVDANASDVENSGLSIFHTTDCDAGT